MPAILTHYYFAKYNLKNINYVNENKKLVFIGSQGSDPFFFYGTLLIRKNSKDVHDFATNIHHINPFNFFNFFIKEANAQNDLSKKNKIYAYLYGILGHYCLDKTCHPYVFYHTGWGSILHSIDHARYESNIDCYLMNHYNDFTSPFKALKNHKSDIKLIDGIYAKFGKLNNPQIKKSTFNKAYKDMRVAQTILFSRFGIKKKFFSLFMKNSQVNAMCTCRYTKSNIDYLNVNKSVWMYPHSGLESNLSFLELQIKAEKEFDKVYQILNKAYKNEDYETELLYFINNIIHDGNPLNVEMKHFKSVYGR